MECKCGAYIDGHRRTCPDCGTLVNIDGFDPSVVSASSNPDAIKFDRAAIRRNRAAIGEAGPAHRVTDAPMQPTLKVARQSAPAPKSASRREKKPQKGMTRDSDGVYQPEIRSGNKSKNLVADGVRQQPPKSSKNVTLLNPKAAKTKEGVSVVGRRGNANSFNECWVEQNIGPDASRAILVLVGHSKETGVSAMLAKTTPFSTKSNGSAGSNSIAHKALTLIEQRAESLGFRRVATGKGPDWYASRFRKK